MIIARDVKKKDLMRLAVVSNYTISKMTRGENVNAETLVKICKALNSGFDVIMEITDTAQNK